MQILIADDDPISLTLLFTVLCESGYEVVKVSDGLEAYKALSYPNAPLVAILDWMMSRLDGTEVRSRISSA